MRHQTQHNGSLRCASGAPSPCTMPSHSQCLSPPSTLRCASGAPSPCTMPSHSQCLSPPSTLRCASGAPSPCTMPSHAQCLSPPSTLRLPLPSPPLPLSCTAANDGVWDRNLQIVPSQVTSRCLTLLPLISTSFIWSLWPSPSPCLPSVTSVIWHQQSVTEVKTAVGEAAQAVAIDVNITVQPLGT